MSGEQRRCDQDEDEGREENADGRDQGTPKAGDEKPTKVAVITTGPGLIIPTATAIKN
jgi:hypothetical protein